MDRFEIEMKSALQFKTLTNLLKSEYKENFHEYTIHGTTQKYAQV